MRGEPVAGWKELGQAAYLKPGNLWWGVVDWQVSCKARPTQLRRDSVIGRGLSNCNGGRT